MKLFLEDNFHMPHYDAHKYRLLNSQGKLIFKEIYWSQP